MALSLEETNKRIQDPARKQSIRLQNEEYLKKTGKAVKSGGKSLLKKVALPVGVGIGAANRVIQDPKNLENVATSVPRGAADLIDEPISAVSEYFGGPSYKPVNTALDQLSGSAFATGASIRNLVEGQPFDRAISGSTDLRDREIARRQDITYGTPEAEQVDLTNVGTQLPVNNERPPIESGTKTLEGDVFADDATQGTDYAGIKGASIREGYNNQGKYVRDVTTPSGGTGSITSEFDTTTDSPERVNELAGNVAKRSQQRGIAEQEIKQQADPAYQRGQQIKQLEEQLAQPGRGLRQSFGEMMQERQVRTAAKTQLKELYDQQKEGQQQAGQTQRAGLVSQDKARDRSLRYRELIGRQGVAATKERQSLFTAAQSDYRAQAKARFPDDPKQQSFFEAELLETHLPGSAWDTTAGRIVRKDAVMELVNKAQDERGFFDWAANFVGLSDSAALTEGDLHKLDFTGWKVDKGEIILPEFIMDNDAFRTNDGNYAYFDNMSPQTVWYIKQRIMKDNPQDFKNKTQTGLRGGQ